MFRDCAEAFKAGLTTSGVYTLTFPNSTEEIKVRCPLPGLTPGCERVPQPGSGQVSLAGRAGCRSKPCAHGSPR